MAYMNQELKKELAPGIKAVLKKYGMTASIGVRHHSGLVVNLRKGPLDIIGNANLIGADRFIPGSMGREEFVPAVHIQVNKHWMDENYSGEVLGFVRELQDAMDNGPDTHNFDKSDTMTDYFHIGWYTYINVGRWNKPYIYEAPPEPEINPPKLEGLNANPFKLVACNDNPVQIDLFAAPVLRIVPVLEIVKAVKIANNPKLAARFRTMADKMQNEIDGKLGERLTNTAKRIKEAAYARQEGDRLERVQVVLRALADLHEAGEAPEALAGIKAKKAIYELVATKNGLNNGNGYHAYYADTGEPYHDTPEALAVWELLKPKTAEEVAADALRAKIEGLQFSNIPGYYATPAAVIDKMLDYADIDILDKCLEPSAGSGAIVDRLLEDSCEVHAYEVNYTLAEILAETTRLGLKKAAFTVTQGDFMEVAPHGYFDKVVMNPPFENGQDIDHVRHAFDFLKPGGRLVAIMSPGPFFRNDKKAKAFRIWFENLGGEMHELPDNSFKASGTGVATRLVIIDKE